MSENNYPQSEANTKLDQVLEPLFAKYHRVKCYPGLIFEQGKRKMVQKNPAKSYKITASANAVRIAVNMAKAHLGWT